MMKADNARHHSLIPTIIFTLIAQIITAVALPAPDFTNGGTIPQEAENDWNLGATGARGWIYSDELTTTDARQIYITKVAAGSPSENKLAVGDIILGINSSLFTSDSRVELAKAITIAEGTTANGQLSLVRWRNGTQTNVTLNLPVLGNYAATAPYNCPKSTTILTQGTTKLALEMAKPDYDPHMISAALNALALLATGDETYYPLIRNQVDIAANFRTNDLSSWFYAYNLILVSEYTLATGNQEFMTEMRELSLLCANGQSQIGSWGHSLTMQNGNLGGYGMMNSPGIPMTIGLTLARLAGVNDLVVSEAIAKSANVLRFYSGKGAVPYGDHYPNTQTHCDNGKCGMASVLFDILGDGSPTAYFSHASLASHTGERDTGHNGNFFNMIWAIPGVNRSGPNATGAWMTEFGSWYFDFARQWDGTYRHQGNPEQDYDPHTGWDSTGAYLLSYAMPLKKIYLTGKKVSAAPQLSPAQSMEFIIDGRGWNTKDQENAYDNFSDNELYEKLGSWSPSVRDRAANSLIKRYPVPQQRLINLLDESDLNTRLGVCQTIAKSEENAANNAVSKLRSLLQEDDLWLRVQAIRALSRIGDNSIAAVPEMFALASNEDVVNDPRKMEQRFIFLALFHQHEGLLRGTIEGVDRELLRDAIRKAFQNQDGHARSETGKVFDKLTFTEIRPLIPAIVDVVKVQAPSGIMFASEIRENGLNLLARYKVGEGMQAAIDFITDQTPWGSEERLTGILENLISYGAHAKQMIPQLEALAASFDDGEEQHPLFITQMKAVDIREAIATIRTLTEEPELIWVRDIEGGATANDPLGILNNSTLGKINPATGEAWKHGDNYRIAFLTSNVRASTSNDINFYNSFVQDLANNSLRGLGSISWRVIASTSNIDARDNTSTNPDVNGLGGPVFLVDGTSIIAENNEDLWDGTLQRLNMDENGSIPVTLVNKVFTGTNPNGTKAGNNRVLGNPNTVITGDAQKTGTGWVTDLAQQSTTPARYYALSDPIKVLSLKPNTRTDSDNGGMKDLMEWALGGDPNSSEDDTLISPKLDLQPDANGKVKFSYQLTEAAKNDPRITIAIQYSHNLKDWTNIQHSGTGNNNVTIVEEDNHHAIGIDQVSVSIPSSMASPKGHLYVRLKITEN